MLRPTFSFVAVALAVLFVLLFARLLLLAADSRRRTLPDGGHSPIAGLRPCPKRPNCSASRAGSAPAVAVVAPIEVSGPADEALRKARAAVESMSGARVVLTDSGYLAAEFTSRWFRFVDDLELLYDAERKAFDVRSASRVGYSDLGANRRRIEALRSRLAG